MKIDLVLRPKKSSIEALVSFIEITRRDWADGIAKKKLCSSI